MPQVSLNFGTSRGWSYIGGGVAFMRRATGDVDAEVADWPRLTGIHYGGGARWFMSPHVAFMFDLRFYRIPEQAAEGTDGAVPAEVAAVPDHGGPQLQVARGIRAVRHRRPPEAAFGMTR